MGAFDYTKGEVLQGDQVTIRTFVDNSHSTLFVDQKMEKEGKVIIPPVPYRLGFRDITTGKPKRIPQEVLDKLYSR